MKQLNNHIQQCTPLKQPQLKNLLKKPWFYLVMSRNLADLQGEGVGLPREGCPLGALQSSIPRKTSPAECSRRKD